MSSDARGPIVLDGRGQDHHIFRSDFTPGNAEVCDGGVASQATSKSGNAPLLVGTAKIVSAQIQLGQRPAGHLIFGKKHDESCLSDDGYGGYETDTTGVTALADALPKWYVSPARLRARYSRD